MDGERLIPKLSDENTVFLRVYNLIAPGLFSGMGGYNYDAIALVFDTYDIPRETRVQIMDKLMVMIQAHSERVARDMEK
jgi:hypothetical protein